MRLIDDHPLLDGRTGFRRKDKHVMFVVQFADGLRGFLRVPPHLAAFGASPAVMKFADQEQRHGRLQPGPIERLVRVR